MPPVEKTRDPVADDLGASSATHEVSRILFTGEAVLRGVGGGVAASARTAACGVNPNRVNPNRVRSRFDGLYPGAGALVALQRTPLGLEPRPCRTSPA